MSPPRGGRSLPSMAVPSRPLGSSGLSVFPLALGCMGMSGIYGGADEAESIATIHAALDAGVNLLDTGDYYGMGHNELLLARALKGRRDGALLSVKFGALRGPDGAWLGIDTRPCRGQELPRLQPHAARRPTTSTSTGPGGSTRGPIEDTIGAIADLVKAGYVRRSGSRRSAPRPSGARRRSTRSGTSRSSTRS